MYHAFLHLHNQLLAQQNQSSTSETYQSGCNERHHPVNEVMFQERMCMSFECDYKKQNINEIVQETPTHKII